MHWRWKYILIFDYLTEKHYASRLPRGHIAGKHKLTMMTDPTFDNLGKIQICSILPSHTNTF
jgi:hypothetical protein